MRFVVGARHEDLWEFFSSVFPRAVQNVLYWQRLSQQIAGSTYARYNPPHRTVFSVQLHRSCWVLSTSTFAPFDFSLSKTTLRDQKQPTKEHEKFQCCSNTRTV